MEPVADALDAVERDAAHGGETGDGGGLHVDEGGVVGGGEAEFLRLSATLGLVTSHRSPASASQRKRSPVRASMTPAMLWRRAGQKIVAQSAGPADGEDERDGAAFFNGGEGARGGGGPAPAQAAIHSSSSLRCAQKRTPLRELWASRAPAA